MSQNTLLENLDFHLCNVYAAKKGESLLHPDYEIHVRDSTDDEKTLLKRSKTFKGLSLYSLPFI